MVCCTFCRRFLVWFHVVISVRISISQPLIPTRSSQIPAMYITREDDIVSLLRWQRISIATSPLSPRQRSLNHFTASTVSITLTNCGISLTSWTTSFTPSGQVTIILRAPSANPLGRSLRRTTGRRLSMLWTRSGSLGRVRAAAAPGVVFCGRRTPCIAIFTSTHDEVDVQGKVRHSLRMVDRWGRSSCGNVVLTEKYRPARMELLIFSEGAICNPRTRKSPLAPV